MDLIEILITAFLGLVQGLTEFLPVSSSGHLLLARKFFGLQEAGLALDTMLHLGTLGAVVIVYWRELLGILKRPFGKMTWMLLIGTIPALLFGFLLADFIEALEVSGVTVGYEFIITALMLVISEMIKDRGKRTEEEMTWLDSLIIGVGQAFAIMPAISRSGSTIFAALFRGFNKNDATHFSFLLSIPAIAAAIAYNAFKVFKDHEPLGVSPISLIVGIVVSFVSGYIAVRWMIAILKKGSLKGFIIYVFGVGFLILFFQWFHLFGF